MKFDDYVQQKTIPSLTPVLNRLIEMVKTRYGCELNYKILDELNDKEKGLLCSLDSKAPALKVENKAFFPVMVKGDLVGAAEVLDCDEICDRSLRALKDIISLVIESLHVTANSLEVISVLEKQLTSTPKKHTNVISINKFKPLNGHTNTYRFNKSFNGTSTFNVPCLLESKSSDDLFKMAVEIHEHSRRFALLSFDQIDLKIRTNPAELKKLGNISLYIKDISKLSDSELFAVIGFLKSERTKEHPQIIGACPSEIKEVLGNKFVPKELVDLLNVAYLRMDKPFDIYKKEGLVEFFFQSLQDHRPLN